MCANNNHRLCHWHDPSLGIKRRVLSLLLFSFYSVVIEHNNRFKCSAIDTVRFIGRVPGRRWTDGRMDGQSKWTGKDSVDDFLTGWPLDHSNGCGVGVGPWAHTRNRYEKMGEAR